MTSAVDDPHMPWSDSNDADQWDPQPTTLPGDGDGVIPDHTASTDSPMPPADESAGKSGFTWPWEKKGSVPDPSPIAGPRRRGRAKDDVVPNLPRGFAQQLTDVYVTIGTAYYGFDPVCGRAIIDSAPKCAASLIDLAKTNPAVRRVLLKLVGTTAVGAVIAAHMPIMMAVAMHHIAPRLQKDTPATPPPMDSETPLYPTEGMWSGN